MHRCVPRLSVVLITHVSKALGGLLDRYRSPWALDLRSSDRTTTSPTLTDVISETAFASVLDEWLAIAPKTAALGVWEARFEGMAAEQSRLRANGRWRTGGRTLLSALGLHHDEVRLCAGLAWLLTPDGWHGLGTSLLRALLDELQLTGLDAADVASASVVTEEWSADGTTRADIVIRLPKSATTVLVEAKVWAIEQPNQCRRLSELWADESPALVYLTRTGVHPISAGSSDRWAPITWATIARLMRQVEAPAWSSGARELMETIEAYGGGPYDR